MNKRGWKNISKLFAKTNRQCEQTDKRLGIRPGYWGVPVKLSEINIVPEKFKKLIRVISVKVPK